MDRWVEFSDVSSVQFKMLYNLRMGWLQVFADLSDCANCFSEIKFVTFR